MILIAFLIYNLSLQIFFFGSILTESMKPKFQLTSVLMFILDFFLNFFTGFYEVNLIPLPLCSSTLALLITIPRERGSLSIHAPSPRSVAAIHI